MVYMVKCFDKELILHMNANVHVKIIFWTEQTLFKNMVIRLFSSKGNDPW